MREGKRGIYIPISGVTTCVIELCVSEFVVSSASLVLFLLVGSIVNIELIVGAKNWDC